MVENQVEVVDVTKSIMKIKLIIFIVCFGSYLSVNAQDTTKIKLDDIEVNFLSSYYQQDGNNSPVTGGKGTEFLTNIAPSININIPLDTVRTLNIDGGVDFYSSASSDNINNPYIDPSHVSGASAKDERSYLTVGYKKKNKNLEFGTSGGFSFEWDVFSYSLGGSFSISSKDKNKSFSAKAKYFYDDWKLIYPVELRLGTKEYLPTDKRHSVNTSFLFSSHINKKTTASAEVNFVVQNGLLSTPFHRVYFKNSNVAVVEMLPSTRIKYPVGIRINSHVTDFMILKTFYRFYADSWGVTGNTFEITAPLKISESFRLYPFYRFHIQKQANYFADYGQHLSTQNFYTSDFDLGSFTSHKYGLGFTYSPLFGLGRFKYSKDKVALFKFVSLRYSHYQRSNGLKADVVTVGLQLNIKK